MQVHNIVLLFSKKELDYLKGNLKVTKNYENRIKHSIRKKIKFFRNSELPLLQSGDNKGCNLLSWEADVLPVWTNSAQFEF